MRPVRLFLVPLAAAAFVPAAAAQGNAALSFNQNDYVGVQPSPSIDSITSAITIEAWVRLNAIVGSPTVVRRDVDLIPSGEVFILRLNNVYPTYMELAFYLQLDGVSRLAIGLAPVSLGEWHHFAGTYDGSAMRIYWDGQLVAVLVVSGALPTSTSEVRIGAGDLTDGWSGAIDEVRLWNLARTQAQIQTDRNSTLVGNEGGLVGYWRFDAATGQTAVDSSPYGNHGQLGASPLPDVNDPSWSPNAASLAVAVTSISPPFGPFYAPNSITIGGTCFVPGATTLSIAGQGITNFAIVNGRTIVATVPPGASGTGDVTVSAPYGTGTLPGGWTWANHLHADSPTVSLGAPQPVGLALFAGPAHALRPYLVVTSLSGTSPGVPLPPFTLPINPDVWTDLGLMGLNTPVFTGFLGILDWQGRGAASFDLSPLLPAPSAAGAQVSFAYLVLQSFTGGYAFVSNPATVAIAP